MTESDVPEPEGMGAVAKRLLEEPKKLEAIAKEELKDPEDMTEEFEVEDLEALEVEFE